MAFNVDWLILCHVLHVRKQVVNNSYGPGILTLLATLACSYPLFCLLVCFRRLAGRGDRQHLSVSQQGGARAPAARDTQPSR